MKITSVNVTPFEAPIPGGTVRAFAEVELDGEVLLRGIQVVETEKGGGGIYPTRPSPCAGAVTKRSFSRTKT